MLVPADQHVLQQIPEMRLDGTLIARVHFNEVRQGAHVADVPVRLDQHHAGGVAERRAVRIELFEGVEPGGERREIVFPRPDLSRSPLVFIARACQFRFSRDACNANTVEAFVRRGQGRRRGRARGNSTIQLGLQICGLHLQTVQPLLGTLAL